jgi:hypothetical protein
MKIKSVFISKWFITVLVTAILIIFAYSLLGEVVAQTISPSPIPSVSPSPISSCDGLTLQDLLNSSRKTKNVQITSSFNFWGGGAIRNIEIPGSQPSNVNIIYCSKLASSKDDASSKPVEVILVNSLSGTDKTQLTLKLPELGWFWTQERFILVGFKINQQGNLETSSPIIFALQYVWVSHFWTCLFLAILVIIGIYSIVVWGVCQSNPNYKFCKLFLSPVALTSGYFGKASLSKLQLFGFTLVVLFRMIYLISRDGLLSGLSDDILLLLGISSAGAGGTKLIGVVKKRLSFDNWAWLRNHKWLTIAERGDGSPSLKIETAKFGDLIKTDGLFDVYSFQLAGFSLIVAAYLLLGVDLAMFKLPTNLLSILGLSNVVYLGGKGTEQNSYQELDEKITKLREAEKDYLIKFPELPQPYQPQQFSDLTGYILLAREVAEMLRALYGKQGTFDGFNGESIADSQLLPKNVILPKEIDSK